MFCAICTDDIGPFGTLELDGRTFNACQKCLSEHPRSGRYSFGSNRGDPRGNVHPKPSRVVARLGR